jgi:carboxylate-amine ligase
MAAQTEAMAPALRELVLHRLRPDSKTAAQNQFTLGIEEEYFLHDLTTNRAATTTPDALFRQANAATNGRVEREFLQAQAEAVTRPHSSMSAARAELQFIRRVLGELAAEHGFALLASGTHPTAEWRQAKQTDKDRYDRAMDDLQMLGQRDMMCGMHVHVALPDPTRRVDVMCRLVSFLPLFVALSTSSPFWISRETGLKSYRLAAYDELPRTGLPPPFRNTEAYDAYVGALVKAGVMGDASFIWWMVRPSPAYPTLELRATDCCTRVEDAIAIAALYRVLVHHLYLNPSAGAHGSAVTHAIAAENKWRAQRYGVNGTFVTDSGAISVADLLEEVLSMTAEDALTLECIEAADCRRIVSAGTSADAQLAVYRANVSSNNETALDAVMDWIARNTLGAGGSGIDEASRR